MVFHNRTKTKTITVEDLNNPENGNTLEMKFNRKGELFRIKRNGQVVDPMTKDFENLEDNRVVMQAYVCLLYTSPSPRDRSSSRMPSSA